MQRREFITLLGSAASWPLVAHAQQAGRLPTIGYLGSSTAAAERSRTDAFVQRLGELGWTEGRTLTIEYRWGENRAERLAEFAAEFVRLQVDIIVPSSTQATVICKKATAVIPIVFPLTGDPLGTGLVASLSRPGGNITGLSNQAADLASKRIEILREVAPALRRLAILANAEYPGRTSEIADVRPAARGLGIEVVILEIRPAEDIAAAFDTLKDRAEAIYVVGDTFMSSNRTRIGNLAVSARLPTIYVARDYVAAGGLISYGANIPHMFRRAAEIVDRILHGAKPADIPVEQPTQFELVINLKTANALGLTVPPNLLATADEVIE
jgi:putative ABC transport system substrate-binding protein